MRRGILRKIAPPGNIGEDVRTIDGPWEGMRGPGERLATKSPTLELKVMEASELRVESSTQVDRSAVGLRPLRKAHRDDWAEIIWAAMPALGHLGAPTVPTG